MASPVSIGIDLGTTFSCVAVYRRDVAEIIQNDQGNHTTPSCVAFTEEGSLIGESALLHLSKNPANTIRSAKRFIGRKFEDEEVQSLIKSLPFKVVKGKHGEPAFAVRHMNEDKQFSPEQVSAMVLTKLKECAEKFVGRPVESAVITVPAYFNDAQRTATKRAARLAGLRVDRLVVEPTAAALAYGLNLDLQGRERHIAVFDLGGGTFDISILVLDDGVFEVLSTGGDSHLGGEDFDELLVRHCAAEFKAKHGKDLTKNARSMGRLYRQCELAKRALSRRKVAEVEIVGLFDGIDFQITISRARFEELCKELFAKVMRLVDECVKAAKLDKDKIEEVVMVGGSSRIPKVVQLVKDYFGKDPCNSLSPDEAVAKGATIQASVIHGKGQEDLAVLDVVPLSLGVMVQGDVMSVVVPRNCSYPCHREKGFTTVQNNQTCIAFEVLEGERARASDNHQLGKFLLDGIEPAVAGEPSVRAEFDIDENGILTVRAMDKGTGKKNQLVIKRSDAHIDEAEVQRMVWEAAQFVAKDSLFRKLAEARSALSSLAKSTLGQIEVIGNGPNSERAKLECEEALQWLDANQKLPRNELQARLKDLQCVCASVRSRYEAMHPDSNLPPQLLSNGDSDRIVVAELD